jgi:hypothetical protein
MGQLSVPIQLSFHNPSKSAALLPRRCPNTDLPRPNHADCAIVQAFVKVLATGCSPVGNGITFRLGI